MTYRVADFGPSDLLTSDKERIRRIKVDAQQTSFESNNQFRFFDELTLPKKTGSQIVYRVSSVNPFTLFSRTVSFYRGGCTYRIYSDDDTHTFDDNLLGDPVAALPVNGDLSDSELPAHPVSTITLERADGNAIFTPGSPARTGTSVRAGTNNAQSSGSLALDSVQLGFPAGFSGWIVMTVINGLADDSQGEYELFFEERYP